MRVGGALFFLSVANYQSGDLRCFYLNGLGNWVFTPGLFALRWRFFLFFLYR